MHYYQHHIGDFIRDTSRLSDSQAMAYLRLLWMYYDTETPIPDTPQVLALKVGCDVDSIKLLLGAFFALKDGNWHHGRCDKEIATYHAFIESQRAKGALGGRPRKTPGKPAALPELTPGKPGVNPNREPLTTNQEPITNTGSPDGFESVYQAYPKKVGKPAALKAWKTAKVKPEEVGLILKDIEFRKAGRDWQKDDGQYIPNPSTYFNQRRWEDSPPPSELVGGLLPGAI